jgi:hypothetical protein
LTNPLLSSDADCWTEMVAAAGIEPATPRL